MQAFDVIDIFFAAALTKTVGDSDIVLFRYIITFIRINLCAALLTLEGTVGALKNLLNSQKLAFSIYCSFFVSGVLQFIVKMDNVSHDRPFLLEKIESPANLLYNTR